jgi:hypothetical protein
MKKRFCNRPSFSTESGASATITPSTDVASPRASSSRPPSFITSVADEMAVCMAIRQALPPLRSMFMAAIA